ncbi:hypothetical protein [Rhodophyticola porphyridii]|uniref:RHS repeat protein n=1 Tax=Rhodophyticola porphyridii TaxID=1852017 RepID=A0A3L9Y5F4_9RHOB|nr:hypothetical protein [Rhodophyticola porphyridii]RMA41356.1 hypothetical protein D9R08_13560 [Rhodophyticola porphyridii]
MSRRHEAAEQAVPADPYSSIANDVLLDFEDGALVRRWLHGPEVDEPLAYERYAGTTAGGTGTPLELFRNRLGSVILAVSVSTGAVAAEYDYDSFGQRMHCRFCSGRRGSLTGRTWGVTQLHNAVRQAIRNGAFSRIP